MVSSLHSQTIGNGEGFVEVPEVRGSLEATHLMDDGVRLRGNDRGTDCLRIETIRYEGLSAVCPNGRGFPGIVGEPHNRMA